MCYGLGQLSGLKTLTVRVERVDGLLLEGKLLADAPTGGKVRREGPRLRVEVEVVRAPAFEVGMFTSATTTSREVQMRWRREALSAPKKHGYLWLSDTIPHLPAGCLVTIQANATMASWEVLNGLKGFRVSQAGRDRWVLVYDEERAS